jgi:hypothetical protein
MHVTGRAFANASGGNGLLVTIQGGDWSILVRKEDFQPDHALAKHAGNEIYACDVAAFLPNWRTLKWKIIPPNLLAKTEIFAIDETYMVNVKAEYQSDKSHRHLIAAFSGFMVRAKLQSGRYPITAIGNDEPESI